MLIPIHERPTKINNLFLCSKYFEKIVKPIIKEIMTNTREKLPCNTSTNSIYIPHFNIIY